MYSTARSVKAFRSHPLILPGGAFFACVAGMINTVGLLSATHSAVSHMTGTVSHLMIASYNGNSWLAFRAGIMLLAFLIGAVLSGAVISNESFGFHRRYGVLIFLEGLVLLIASACFQHELFITGEGLCAFICGMQNGMVTVISSAIVRTTHVTGIITDLGTQLGQALRGGSLHWQRIRIHLAILIGFCAGGFGAGFLFYRLEYGLLDGLAGLLMLIGLIYFLVRRLRPHWLWLDKQ